MVFPSIRNKGWHHRNSQTETTNLFVHSNFNFFFFFLISNKDSLISKREIHQSTPGVYKGEQIKNEHYKNQENPK